MVDDDSEYMIHDETMLMNDENKWCLIHVKWLFYAIYLGEIINIQNLDECECFVVNSLDILLRLLYVKLLRGK